MQAHPFPILGLPDDASEADIRKAYAEKLKATHPEDDPEGFKLLRWAYETALSVARWRARNDADTGDGEADANIRHPEPVGTPPKATPYIATAATAPESTKDAHATACNRLDAALRTGAGPDELHAALDAVLGSPALANVDEFHRTESWLVDLLTGAGAVSEPLLEKVIGHFQWDRNIADHRSPGPAAVLALRDRRAGERVAAEFLARVQDSRHEFHPAWQETVRDPAGRSWLSHIWSLRRYPLVEHFFRQIELRAPLAIEALNADAVFWWRNAGRGLSVWPRRAARIAVRLAALGLLVAFFMSLDSYNTDSARRPSAPSMAEYLAEPSGPDAATHLQRVGARAECEAAMKKLQAASRSQWNVGTAIVNVDRLCQRELDVAPDSILLNQHVGVIALAVGRRSQALDRFQSIRTFSPHDPYALFGAGLSFPDHALLADAQKRDPAVRAYFRQFPITIPDVGPADGEPRSRLPPRERPKFDTPAKKLADPTEGQVKELLIHFGMPAAPVGEAALDCLVKTDGRTDYCVVDSETPRNSGVAELAIRMALLTRFEPARLEGKPVNDVPVRLTIATGKPEAPK